mmetsp:Transcript_7044/g.6235  ORF Transcript_7044/g.6235 Transcript_7044/m.6235 type:complete len:133 (+) Transcript_7044:6-404(+)
MVEYKQQIIPQNFSSQGPLEMAGSKKAVFETHKIHPVKVMQDNLGEVAEKKKLAALSVQYGSALPSLLLAQRSMMGQVQRTAGKNSFHGLKESMGLYDEITFNDILNDPYENPCFAKETTRDRLEKKYGVTA